MSAKVNQPNALRPTNKLSAAVIASALIALARWAVPALDDDALWIGLTPLIVLGVGYFVRDEDNSDPYMVSSQRGI